MGFCLVPACFCVQNPPHDDPLFLSIRATHTHTHTSASIVSTSILDTSYQSCEMAQSSRIHMTFDRLWFYMYFPSKIKWDLTNGPLSKLLELLDTQFRGPFSGSCWRFLGTFYFGMP